MKGVLEVVKKKEKRCVDMSSISIPEMSRISILWNLVQNSKIPLLENNFKEIGRVA